MQRSTVLQLTSAMTLVLSCASAPALAQSAEATGGGATDGASDSGLADIVVTAQRREESLQKAAIAITAVSADTLVRAGVTDTSQLTRVAPALQIGTLAGPMAQFYVRGVGKFTANSLTDSAISVNIDGVPIARDGAIQGMFYDLERIEVLKGPQGTLYGRNATGGAVNFLTAKPRLGELSGYLNAEYGNFDALKLTGALNVPAGQNGAFRVAGMISNHDGYYSDGTGDEKMEAIRLQLSTQLSDKFKLTLGGDYAHVGGVGSGSTVHGLDRDQRIGLLDPRAGAIYSTTFSPLAGTFLNPITTGQFSDNQYWGVHAQADLDTSIGTLTVIPAYRNANVRYSISSGSFPVNDRMKDEQVTVEARLTSHNDGPLSYIVGAFFLSEHTDQKPGYTEQYFNAHGRFLSDTKSYAGFARLTYKLTDSFRLTGGARYTIDNKSALLDAYNIVVICPSLLGGGAPCIGTPPLPIQFDVPAQFVLPNGDAIPVQPWGTDGAIVTTTRVINTPSRTFKKLTYRLGFEFDAGPQSLIYGSYETGFKSGGFFSTIDNPVYNPETISAFTLGSKNRFLDNRLQLNAELFWWTYKDQQVSHFRLNSQGANEFVTENIGQTRIRGFEIEAKALVGQGTTLNATVQFLDATTTDFIYKNPVQAGPPNTGCPAVLDGANYVINCSGRRAVNAPKWTISGGVEQVFELGSGGKIRLNADARWQSASFTGFEQLPSMEQGSYFLLDLHAQYEFPGSHMTIAGFVNNVTDENVVGFSAPHPFGPALVVESLRPPRTYGVRVGYKF